MRLLRCVWRGTHKAAGRHCDTSERPIAIRMCDSQSLKLLKCAPGDDDLDNNTFLRKSTINDQKSEYSTKLDTTTTFLTPNFSFDSYLTTKSFVLHKNNTKIEEYSIWKEKNTTPKLISFNSQLNLPKKDKNLLSFSVEPFKGWERWRGWKLYNWPQPQNDLRRLISN